MVRLSPLIVFGLFTFAASADAFSITPTRITLDPLDKVAVLKLENSESQTTSFTVKAFSWMSSQNLNDIYPTDEILVIPPIIEIEPGNDQVIRLALKGPVDAAEEKTYRVVISELAPEVGEKQGINLNYRVSIPVYVASEGARPVPIWSLISEKNGRSHATLAMSNRGTSHLRVDKISLGTSSESPPLVDIRPNIVAFAGEQKTWPLDVALNELKGPLTLKAETNIGPIEALVSLPRD